MDELTDLLFAYVSELVAAFLASGQPLAIDESRHWVVGDDGNAREQVVDSFYLGGYPHTFKDSSKTYGHLIEAIRRDPVFRPVVGSLVSNLQGSSLFDEDTIINKIVAATNVTAHAILPPTLHEIGALLDELSDYIDATERFGTIIIPISGMTSSILPFAIEDGIVIDQLSSEEVDYCVKSNVLRTWMGEFPFLRREECIGIRITTSEPAYVVRPEDLPALQAQQMAALDERSTRPRVFGDRSHMSLIDLVDDLLFTLRLASKEYVGATGAVFIARSHMGVSRTWQVRPSRSFVMSSYVLDVDVGEEVRRLWDLLKQQSGRSKSLPSICRRRFNLAVDRSSLDDTLIDHLIAAEALFLKGSGEEENRGELGFRLALRISLFLRESYSNVLDTFRFTKKAYGLRSQVAHGGTLPGSARVPGRIEATPSSDFAGEFAELMRNCLRKAIDLYSSTGNFGTPEYWDELLFSSGAVHSKEQES